MRSDMDSTSTSDRAGAGMPQQRLDSQGFALLPGLLDAAQCGELITRLAPSASPSGGSREELDAPWCQHLAARLQARLTQAGLIPAGHRAVQCTYFEKSAARNWLVPLHQDLSIAVAQRIEAPGLTGWSCKHGRHYVQPPAALLARLLALRLHLDPCGPEDGALSVVPGSHRAGRLTPEQGAAWRQRHGSQLCLAQAGTGLLMRPLLLHASSRAQGQSRRRVLHFLFGPAELPLGLSWAQAGAA